MDNPWNDPGTLRLQARFHCEAAAVCAQYASDSPAWFAAEWCEHVRRLETSAARLEKRAMKIQCRIDMAANGGE